MKTVYVQGLPPGPGPEAVSSAIRNIILKTTDNLLWLKEGETVLLKPALNSPDPYPSTTHPLAVSATAGLLAERGAKVVIGDQSGIEHVLHHPGGVLHGRTSDNYARSGMGLQGDSRFVSFEEGGWDDGFYRYSSANTGSWRDGFFITAWMKKADHIISLPRVSAHSQAGATLGLKSMVGMLREDSRLEFHANGPYNMFITRAARGSTLTSTDDGTDTFFEKIVEISDAIRDKLRFTLYVATEVQATFGPDRYGIRAGPVALGHGYVVRPDPPLVFGSADQIAAEAVALAVLKDARQSLPFFPRLSQRVVLFQNPHVRELDRTGVHEHPYIRHGMKIGLGGMPGEIAFEDVPEPARERLRRLLR
ncbi:MAG: DUF362 domain-containing protein [Methanoregula sp.]|jgi:hypothetical protein